LTTSLTNITRDVLLRTVSSKTVSVAGLSTSLHAVESSVFIQLADQHLHSPGLQEQLGILSGVWHTAGDEGTLPGARAGLALGLVLRGVLALAGGRAATFKLGGTLRLRIQ